MGTWLLLMVAALPRTRSGSIDERTALMAAATALGDVQEQLVETVETETVVKPFAARNMPQTSQAGREVELAAALLRVGLNGARSNLEARLSSLTDVVYMKTVVEEIAHLSEEATTAARAAEWSVQAPPA